MVIVNLNGVINGNVKQDMVTKIKDMYVQVAKNVLMDYFVMEVNVLLNSVQEILINHVIEVNNVKIIIF